MGEPGADELPLPRRKPAPRRDNLSSRGETAHHFQTQRKKSTREKRPPRSESAKSLEQHWAADTGHLAVSIAFLYHLSYTLLRLLPGAITHR